MSNQHVAFSDLAPDEIAPIFASKISSSELPLPQPRIIGSHPRKKDARGRLKTRVVTVFPEERVSTRALTSRGYDITTTTIAAADSSPYLPGKADCQSGDFTGVSVCSRGNVRFLLMDLMGTGNGARPYRLLFQRALREGAGSSLCDLTAQMHAEWPKDEDRFATMIGIQIESAAEQVAVLRAGHPAPILRDASGSARFLDAPLLGAIGIDDAFSVTQMPMPKTYPLPAGAVLVLFSDGVLDAGVRCRNDAFGPARLLDAVNSAGEDVQGSVLRRVLDHLRGASPEDDFTLVAIKRSKQGP